jgi:hypothetical protein
MWEDDQVELKRSAYLYQETMATIDRTPLVVDMKVKLTRVLPRGVLA